MNSISRITEPTRSSDSISRVGQEIAKDLGVTLEIKDMKFDGLLAALDSGNVDIVLAGMSPTDERKKTTDFSEIYYRGEQGVIVRAGRQG